MYIIIVGGGNVGYYLAKELVEADHEVLIIEENAARAAEIAETLGEIVMHGDGCEASIHQQAGTGRADLILAVTGGDPSVAALEYSVARFSKKLACSTPFNISSSQGSGFLSVR